MVYHSDSVEYTESLGFAFARQLKPGDVAAFFGDLGAGKTAFIRGMARGLGIFDAVTSPTYTIVNEYQGSLPLFHFDLYRLSSADDLFDIGWEDYLERGGVCAVEWSQRAVEEFDGYYKITIIRLSDNEREITIEGGDKIDMSRS